MKDLTHIRRFNESEENLNISDVRSNDDTITLTKHEQIRNEILNNSNIPQDLKDRMNNLKTEFETKWSEEDKWIKDNLKNGKKIIDYDNETFLPIFEK
jgi:hypothetical protein